MNFPRVSEKALVWIAILQACAVVWLGLWLLMEWLI